MTASFWAASCAVALGPGYTIEKQELRVRFVAQREPQIRLAADYQLKNTGTRPLNELALRLPGRRRFQYENPNVSWDSTTVAFEPSPENARETVIALPQAWIRGTRHTLHLSVEYSPTATGDTTLSFSKDAFFLPAAGWSPELLPPNGLFPTGGVPPKRWNLEVAAPESFQIRASGLQKKNARKRGEKVVLAEQGKRDPHPFVIAGRYHTAEIGRSNERVHLWTNEPQDSTKLRDVSDALARIIAAYDAAFGERSRESSQIWIVECPVAAGCFSNLNSLSARLLWEKESGRSRAEMISQDTMVVDLSAGTPTLASSAAPSLAASWLGYAQNPGFFEQRPPLTMFPAFAAAVGHDAAEGEDSRGETIRRALLLVPPGERLQKEDDQRALSVKSFLFFYALQDRYGRETFRKATQHMLYARQEHSFDLSDFIAAFEEETHQNVAEFVRMWMKRPGVPEEFRARYEFTTAAAGSSTKETKQ
ncbi:MAG TPA: hypothetical protein VNB49_14275 [Candidatus Dormibacteraeota bacterium]|nr:hypothetical protein [Candidatus Dormibacteraeota bacterium]